MGHYFINDKNLKENIKTNEVEINNIKITFLTDSGLFNKKGLDYGTRLLLENFDLSNKQSFLDMGCGCGPVGLYISKLSKEYKVDMVDINEKAIDICNKSAKLNNISNVNIYLSNVYENINNKYDAILTNPPIHAGKKVVYEIIGNAYKYLNKDGELWIVMRKDQGAKSMIKDFSNIYNFEIIKKDKGFLIIKGIV
jgi:16S rRNA (guanine1207-N2)-methyltransferase